jgi:hypothetical protein
VVMKLQQWGVKEAELGAISPEINPGEPSNDT